MLVSSETEVLLFRHAPKGGPGGALSPEGHDLARQVGFNELAPHIEKLPQDAVVLMMPVSNALRTRETMADLETGLNAAHLPDVTMIDMPQVIEDRKQTGQTTDIRSVRTWLTEQIAQKPNQKIVIHLPLEMAQLSISKSEYLSLDEHVSPYAAYNDSLQDNQALDWLTAAAEVQENGVAFDGPNPQLVANEVLTTVDRAIDFVNRQAPTDLSHRPVCVVMVGHSWSIDAAVATALNGGKFNAAAVEKLHGSMINPAEFASFTINGDQVTTQYRGQQAQSPIFWR